MVIYLSVCVCVNLFSHLLAHKIRIKHILPQFIRWCLKAHTSARTRAIAFFPHSIAQPQTNCKFNKIRFQWFVIMKSIFYMFTAIKRWVCARLHRIFCCYGATEKGEGKRAMKREWVRFCWSIGNYTVTFLLENISSFCCCCVYFGSFDHCSLIYSEKVENVFHEYLQANKTIDSTELSWVELSLKQQQKKDRETKRERNRVIYKNRGTADLWSMQCTIF